MSKDTKGIYQIIWSVQYVVTTQKAQSMCSAIVWKLEYFGTASRLAVTWWDSMIWPSKTGFALTWMVKGMEGLWELGTQIWCGLLAFVELEEQMPI